MSYVKTSTANPLGHKPWQWKTSNNGLNRYDAANFVLPTSTVGDPLNAPMWRGPGMGRYTAQPFQIPTHGLAGMLSRGRLGEYTAQSFEIPTSTVLVGNPPPPWGRSGMGDYEVDPATLPPAPAGMQYNAAYQLVPIPPPSNVPLILGALAVAAGAYWYFEGGGKKFFAPAKVKLPVVQTLPGVRA